MKLRVIKNFARQRLAAIVFPVVGLEFSMGMYAELSHPGRAAGELSASSDLGRGFPYGNFTADAPNYIAEITIGLP